MIIDIVKKIKEEYGIKKVDVAIVCGSGLADALPELENKIIIPYDKIGMPKSKVKGHCGNFTFGKYNGKTIVFVSRIHYYESGNVELVRLPFEIVAKLGVKECILLTSTGGINATYKVGDLVLIKDHINLVGINPLVGIEEMKFTNMLDCYNADLRKLAVNVTNKVGVSLKEGVFVQTSGPSYETKAEVNMLRIIGCDVVSMSTAFDCIIANYLKMKVIGFAVVVNVYNNEVEDVSHEEVLINAKKASENLKKILCEII